MNRPTPPKPANDRHRAETGWELDEVVRSRRLREQGQRSLAENLAEGLALSEFSPASQAPRGADGAIAAARVDCGVSVRVCSLEALRAMKQASTRPQDRQDLEALDMANS